MIFILIIGIIFAAAVAGVTVYIVTKKSSPSNALSVKVHAMQNRLRSINTSNVCRRVPLDPDMQQLIDDIDALQTEINNTPMPPEDKSPLITQITNIRNDAIALRDLVDCTTYCENQDPPKDYDPEYSTSTCIPKQGAYSTQINDMNERYNTLYTKYANSMDTSGGSSQPPAPSPEPSPTPAPSPEPAPSPPAQESYTSYCVCNSPQNSAQGCNSESDCGGPGDGSVWYCQTMESAPNCAQQATAYCICDSPANAAQSCTDNPDCGGVSGQAPWYCQTMSSQPVCV